MQKTSKELIGWKNKNREKLFGLCHAAAQWWSDIETKSSAYLKSSLQGTY